MNDSLNVSGALDGAPLLVRKAYNTITPRSPRFIGYYAEVTHLVAPGKTQTLTLSTPPKQGWATKTGALSAGSDVEVIQGGSVTEAQARCAAVGACVGFTFRKPSEAATCADVPPAESDLRLYLKSSAAGNGDADWCTVTEPPKPLGVYFENVETIFTSVLRVLT